MTTRQTSFWLTPRGLSALLFIGAAAYFLLMEHRQHLYEFLPYLILLACVFMHMFMHGGHGQHGGESDRDAYMRGLEDGRKEKERQKQ